MAESGKLKPRLDPRHFGLAEVGETHAILETNAASGGVVFDVRA